MSTKDDHERGESDFAGELEVSESGRVRRPSSTDKPTGLAAVTRSAALHPLDIMESIKGLHELHQKGGLTEEEFTLAKQQILESPSVSTLSTTSSVAAARLRKGHHHHTHHNRSHSHSHSSSVSSSSSSSSSSSGSSSDSSDHFMVLPKARVWKDLETRSDHSGSSTLAGLDSAPGDLLHPSTIDNLALQQLATTNTADSDNTTIQGVSLGKTNDAPTRESAGLFHPSVDGLPRPSTSTVRFETTTLPQSPVTTGESSRPNRYGTFSYEQSLSGWLGRGRPLDQSGHMDDDVLLEKEDVVKVHYFNSRGVVGKTFAEVELQPHELRAPIYLRKNKIEKPPEPDDFSFSSPASPAPAGLTKSASLAELGLIDEKPPLAQSRTAFPAAAPPAPPRSTGRSSRSSCSSASFLEQSLNWHWIDVTGKDANEKQYKKVIRALTRKFNLCESFLVDREHRLTLPQVLESPTHPGQYLLNLRVASQRISLADDSAQLLTNRWIVIIDLHRPVIITFHRVDTRSMALLRARWKKVMESSEISFQQFLLKIIDDAIYTYQLSLDVHDDLLDKCELKLFAGRSSHFQWESQRAADAAARRSNISLMDARILSHFADSSSSPFLRQLLDGQSRKSLPKGETNSFLHHLHRRTSVQLRMLNVTLPVLAEAFTKLRLCSKELSAQMTSSCRELSDRALEVRDDAKTLLDLHLSLQSFRTNELMAVLTRLSLFFTPCTFFAGVYGMNFEHFPELSWTYGYAYFWAVCIMLVIGMQIYFRRQE